MRHTRARRRLTLILISLLTVSIILFFESRIESFAPQLKDFAELKIENALDKKFKFSIGSLEGGIFHPLALNECVITDERGSPLFPSIYLDNVISNYRAWDFLFKRKAASPCVDVTFSSKGKTVSGFIRLEGKIDDAMAKGYIRYLEKDRVDFTGRIKRNSFELELKPAHGIVKAEGSISDDGSLTADIKIGHLKLGEFDITCDAVLRNKFVTDSNDPKAGLVEGDLEINNLIVNYSMPLPNLKSSYRIFDGVLNISGLEIGYDFKINGKVLLKKPYDTDIILVVDNLNLSRILSNLNAQESMPISGTMNGSFELKGPVKNIKLDGRLDMRHGMLGGIDFEHLNAKLKGDLPIIHIEDSRITRASGYFILGGEIDLSKAGRGSMFEGVKMASSDTAIIWDGWNTTRIQDIQEVRMKKRMSEEVDLGFKKFVADERIDESLRETDEYELEYNLNPNESLKIKVGQEQDFFGLEHKNKF